MHLAAATIALAEPPQDGRRTNREVASEPPAEDGRGDRAGPHLSDYGDATLRQRGMAAAAGLRAVPSVSGAIRDVRQPGRAFQSRSPKANRALAFDGHGVRFVIQGDARHAPEVPKGQHAHR